MLDELRRHPWWRSIFPNARHRAIRSAARTIVEAARKQGVVDAAGIRLDLASGTPSAGLIISCSGIVPAGSVIYAMENTSRRIATNKLFLCDPASAWYYGGIAGHTATLDETILLVGEIVRMIRPAMTFAIGTSGGGYMALLLAKRLGLDRALALGPQTRLDEAWRRANGDDRWHDNMVAIAALAGADGPARLADLLGDTRGAGRPRLHVIYSDADRLDALHARELANTPAVTIHPLAAVDHNCSAVISAAGRLGDLLDIMIEDCPDDERSRRVRALVDAVGTPAA